MRIDSPKVSNLTFQEGATVSDSSFTGSFSGSFTGVGNFTGLTADSVDYTDVLNKPTLFSGSAQVDVTSTTNYVAPAISDVSGTPTLVSGITAAEVRSTLGVDASGTDNSTDVTLVTTSHDYLSLSGQAITLGQIDISDDTNLAVSDTTGQTGINLTLSGDTLSGTLAGLGTSATPTFAGLTVNGNITTTGNVDGRDVAADGTKLDGIDSSATNTADPAIESDGSSPSLASGITAAEVRSIISVDEAGTDNSTDVTLTGAPDYITISGQTITRNAIDLTSDVTGDLPITEGGTGASTAAAARSNLGVDAAGTDNSTDVTLSGTPDYITISGQVITRNKIDLANDVTGTLPVGNMSATALTTIQTAANESAQLALTTQEGDVVVRTDESKTYMHNGGDAGTMADFTELATPTDSVTSVNGNTGAVTVTENVTTNLSTTANGTSLVINSSDGTNASIPAATTSAWGAMTDDDKTKLNGIATGAEVNVDTNITISEGSTTVEVQSSTGTNDSIAAATTSAAGVMTAADKTKLNGIATSANNYSLPEATSTVRGGIELFSDTEQTVAANSVSSTASRTYGIQLNSDGQAVVNVPWSDTDTNTQLSDAQVRSKISGTGLIGYNNSTGVISTTATNNTGTVTNVTVGTGLDVEDGGTTPDITLDLSELTETTAFAGNVGDFFIVLDGNAERKTTAANIDLSIFNNDSGFTSYTSNQATDTSSDVQFDSLGIGTAASGTTGEIRATGDITAYYSSDERLKENFSPLTGALDKINAIGGYEFDWKDGIEDIVSKKGHDIGVKAQELQAQYPELVHERDNGYLAVDYVKLSAVLIEAVKELSAKVAALENN